MLARLIMYRGGMCVPKIQTKGREKFIKQPINASTASRSKNEDSFRPDSKNRKGKVEATV